LPQVDLIDGTEASSRNDRRRLEGFAAGPAARGSTCGFNPLLKNSFRRLTTAPVYYDYQAMIQKDSEATIRALLFSDRMMFCQFSNPEPERLRSVASGESERAYVHFGELKRATRGTSGTRRRARDCGLWTRRHQPRIRRAVPRKSTTHPIGGRVELSEKIARGVIANVGLDMVYEPYDIPFGVPPSVVPANRPRGDRHADRGVELGISLLAGRIYRNGSSLRRLASASSRGFASTTTTADEGLGFARASRRQDLKRALPAHHAERVVEWFLSTTHARCDGPTSHTARWAFASTEPSITTPASSREIVVSSTRVLTLCGVR